jgi:polyisoprenoid-binding protein YceI
MTKAIAAASLCIFAVPVLAGEHAFDIDSTHTQAIFLVDRFGFTSILGVFAKSGGTVWIDEDHLANSRVDAWVTTESVWSADTERDSYIRGEHWLDAASNPKITFKSTRVEPTGANTMKVTGDLTAFGQTRPVTFLTIMNKIGIDIVTKRRAAGFSLQAEISRREFGSTTAGGLIGDTVSIRIESLAVARP